MQAVATEARVRSVATVLPAIATLLFGVMLLFVVGFMQMAAVHNSTHDTRHANGFVCH